MLCVNVLFCLLLAGIPKAQAQIDLHAHLHMKPGLGIFLQGSFQEAPKSTNWSERIYTKASVTTLSEMTKETRPKLIVLSLYGHPYLGYSFARDGFHFDRKQNVRRSVEQEYQEFTQFVREHSENFAIARNASEARLILKQGKTVIVLSLEGAWATLDSPEDFHRWIEERGLSIVTPVHLTPDSLGGNALMSKLVGLANSAWDFLKSVWSTRGLCFRHICKSVEGFTEEGNKAVDELMRRKVWIDVAHSNEMEVASIIQKYEAASLPLLITHTQLRDFFPAERGLGQLEINYIRKFDGIIGLLPSQYMMPEAMKNSEDSALKNHPEEKSASSASKGLSCISGLDVFRNTLAYAIATLGAPEKVALGSDVNAPLDGLSPGCGEITALNPSQLDLHRRGYYTYSQWNALTQYLAPSNTWADLALEHFLILWQRVRP